MMTKRPKDSEKGQILIIVALMMTAIIALTALPLDAGNAFYQRRKMQTAADAASRAAVFQLARGNYSLVTSTAESYAHYNGVPGTGSNNVTVEYSTDGTTFAIGTPTASTRYIRVTTENPNFSTFFLGIVGRYDLSTSARAAAAVFTTTPKTTATGLLPMAIQKDCNVPGSSYNLWSPSGPADCATTGLPDSNYKGVIDMNVCSGDCSSWGAGTNYSNQNTCATGTSDLKVPNASCWSYYGFDGTIGTGNTLGLYSGNLGANVAGSDNPPGGLKGAVLSQGLVDTTLCGTTGSYPGYYGIFLVPTYSTYDSTGHTIAITGFATIRLCYKDIDASSMSATFLSTYNGGGAPGSVVPASGYTGSVVGGMTE